LPLLSFVLLGGLRMKAQWASLISLGVAVAAAIAVYGMPFGQTIDAGAEGAASGLFPIMWIVIKALWIFPMTEKTGDFAVLRCAFSSISDDRRVQVVMIAFLLRCAARGARRLRHADRDLLGDVGVRLASNR
jgi:lactate permease